MDKYEITPPVESGPPTEEYLRHLRTELGDMYKSQDQEIDDSRAIREMRDTVHIDTKFRVMDWEHHDSSVADHVQRVAAMHTVNWPGLAIKSIKEGETAQENSTKREKFHNELLKQAGKCAGQNHTFVRIGDGVFGDGGAWSKLVYTRDTWDERFALKSEDFTEDVEVEPEERDDEDRVTKPAKTRKEKSPKGYSDAVEEAKRQAGAPFQWVYCDPRTIYPVYRAGKLRAVLEVMERPQSDAFHNYQMGRDAAGDIVAEELAQPQVVGTTPGAVEFLIFTDKTWCAYMIASVNNRKEWTGKVVQRWKHRMGGHGYFFTAGWMASYWSNRKVGWGAGALMAPLCSYRSFLRTMNANLVARDTLAPMFRELPAGSAPIMGDDGQPKGSEPWVLGQVITGRPGETMRPFQFPQVPSLREELAMTTQEISKLSVPRVEGNLASADNGFAQVQAKSDIRTRFDPYVKSIEETMDGVVTFIEGAIAGKLQESVWVQSKGSYLELKPEDIRKDVTIHWTLNTEQPNTLIIENRYWSERIQNGTAHVDMAVEALGDNADEVRRGKLRDKLRMLPIYTKLALKKMVEFAGRGDIMQAVAEADQIVEQGALPGQPNPGTGPQAAPGGMGTDIVPDMGSLAQSPGGAQAMPQNPMGMGSPVGPSVQQAAGAAGVQQLG